MDREKACGCPWIQASILLHLLKGINPSRLFNRPVGGLFCDSPDWLEKGGPAVFAPCSFSSLSIPSNP